MRIIVGTVAMTAAMILTWSAVPAFADISSPLPTNFSVCENCTLSKVKAHYEVSYHEDVAMVFADLTYDPANFVIAKNGKTIELGFPKIDCREPTECFRGLGKPAEITLSNAHDPLRDPNFRTPKADFKVAGLKGDNCDVQKSHDDEDNSDGVTVYCQVPVGERDSSPKYVALNLYFKRLPQ